MDARSLAGLALEPSDVAGDPEQRSRRCGAQADVLVPRQGDPEGEGGDEHER